MNTEGLYDWFSFYYDALYSRLLDYEGDVNFVLRVVRKYLDLSPGAVLDVGCGTGSHLLQFARCGLQIFGVDNSIVALESARLKLSAEGRLLLQDMTVLDTGFEIDLAISMLSSLGYLLDQSELQQTLARIRAVIPAFGGLVIELWQEGVLQPNTEALITVPFGDHQLTRRSLFLPSPRNEARIVFEFLEHAGENVIRGPVAEEHTIRLFSRTEITTLISEAGFEIVTLISGGAFQQFAREDRDLTANDLRAIVIAR